MVCEDKCCEIIRLLDELAELAAEDQLQVIRGALEKRKRKMARAPYGSKVLTPEEIKELLSYAPAP
jgi:hypothetical protein